MASYIYFSSVQKIWSLSAVFLLGSVVNIYLHISYRLIGRYHLDFLQFEESCGFCSLRVSKTLGKLPKLHTHCHFPHVTQNGIIHQLLVIGDRLWSFTLWQGGQPNFPLLLLLLSPHAPLVLAWLRTWSNVMRDISASWGELLSLFASPL